MKTKTSFGRNVIAVLVVTFAMASVACPKRKAKETVLKAANNPAQCPNVLAGHSYNADTTASVRFIEVINDTDRGRLVLNFNGMELLPVDGKQYGQHNGYQLLAACVDNSIKIEGKNESGQEVTVTVKPADDGGLQLDKDNPERLSLHYTKATAIKSTFDELKSALTPQSEKQKGTGIPTSADLKPEQPLTAPQQQPLTK